MRTTRLPFAAYFTSALAALLVAGVVPTPTVAQDIRDTRLLSQPAVSLDHIAFLYAGDLWVANRDGSGARRLTTHVGTESNPRFSPDGRWIAFSGQYDGNTDVFLVPVEGGAPNRLTWHPGADVVQGFSPDGSEVLFASPRNVHTSRFRQLFTVSVGGGMPEQLPLPQCLESDVLAGRVAYRLYPSLRVLQPVEALPGRESLTHLAVQRGGPLRRADPSA